MYGSTIDCCSANEYFQERGCEFCPVSLWHEDGMVKWEPGGQFVALCDMDITYFPFDVQMCGFLYSTWSTVSEQVNLTLDGQEGIPVRQENGEWEVLDTRISLAADTVGYSVGQIYSKVKYQLLLRRRPAFYLTNIVYPAMMLSSLASLMFFLPPGGGERISMGATLILSFTVFILIVSEHTPRTSQRVPLIRRFTS